MSHHAHRAGNDLRATASHRRATMSAMRRDEHAAPETTPAHPERPRNTAGTTRIEHRDGMVENNRFAQWMGCAPRDTLSGFGERLRRAPGGGGSGDRRAETVGEAAATAVEEEAKMGDAEVSSAQETIPKRLIIKSPC